VELASPPLNVEQLWAELLGKFPALAAHRANVRLARNWEYAAPDVQFMNADEIALIPPVSGG
jgi:molybdopterin converting factor small subunit